MNVLNNARQLEVAILTDNIPDGEDVTVGPFWTHPYDQVAGVIQADQILDVAVYHGHLEDAFPVENTFQTTGNPADGAGDKVESETGGTRWAKVVITNNSGSDTTVFSAGFYLERK